MPSIFDSVTLEWGGKKYTIPADRTMEAIARIEEHVTLAELSMWSKDSSRMRISSMASAFASVLRYAGASVTAEDVYAGIFKDGGMSTTVSAMQAMLVMMIPPSVLNAEVGDAPKKTRPSGSSKARSGR